MSELTTNELTSQSHEDKWIGIIDSWKTSNLSQAEYCRRGNISYYKFIYWKRKLASDHSSSGLTLLKLESPGFGQNFNRQSSPLPHSPIRFWLRDFCIEVGDNFSPVLLSRLVETLRSV